MSITWPIPATLIFATAVTLSAQTEWFNIDTLDREQTRLFHNAIYLASENVPSGWTGSYNAQQPQNSIPGDTSADFKDATLLRIQYYRAMAGVPAWIAFDATLNQKAQQAALMMSFADTLDHEPYKHPQNFPYYTPDGSEAAGNSNLAYGTNGPDSIDGYIWDFGENNNFVGHRNWIFYPQTITMGTGDVDGNPQLPKYAANALWVFDPDPNWQNRPYPATREEFIAWPPAGYTPRSVVYPRWSFSMPNANFSQATVTMLRNGDPIDVRLEDLPRDQWGNLIAFGHPTLVWVPLGLDANVFPPTTWPDEGADTVYTVNLNNVLINSSSRNFQYDVIVFNPREPLPGTLCSGLMGAMLAPRSSSTDLAAISLPYAESAEVRIFTSEGSNWSDGAESPNGLISPQVTQYNAVQSARKVTGNNAFVLKTVSFTSSHTLDFDGSFLIQNTSRLQFASQRRFASEDQLSAAELSIDNGSSWLTIWDDRTLREEFTPPPFENIDLDLSPWQGKLARLRFIYHYSAANPGSGVTGYNFDSTPEAGWAIDNIQLSSAAKLNETDRADTDLTPWITVHPAPDNDPLYFQLRNYAFGGYPLEWGPLHRLTFTDDNIPSIPEIQDGEWIWDPNFGWLLGIEPMLAYSPLLGWLHFNHFPYFRNLEGTWCRWGQGDALNGFSIYVFNQGWQFVQPSTNP